MRAVRLIPLLLLLPMLLGCVKRQITIETEPPGAAVWIDGEEVGETPLTIPFTHYGTREFIVRLPGHHSLRVEERIRVPWYEIFPIEIVTEILWPGTILDEHRFHYTLKPME